MQIVSEGDVLSVTERAIALAAKKNGFYSPCGCWNDVPVRDVTMSIRRRIAQAYGIQESPLKVWIEFVRNGHCLSDCTSLFLAIRFPILLIDFLTVHQLIGPQKKT